MTELNIIHIYRVERYPELGRSSILSISRVEKYPELGRSSILSISRVEKYPELGRSSILSISRVEKYPELGRYDLKIENTTYDRDNGNFKCMVKQGGTGVLLHIKKIRLNIRIFKGIVPLYEQCIPHVKLK